MVATTNVGILTPTQGDPTYRNNWADGIVNPNMGLIDDYTAGGLTKSVAGSVNVALTYTDGATCEARHSYFAFTGVLTGSIDVLWPNGHELNFSVSNQTTGAFTLSLGVNNGSGIPAGAVAVIANGGAAQFFRSDGTNVVLVGSSPVSVPVPINQGGTGQITQALAFNALSPLTTKGDLIGDDGTNNVRVPVGTDGQALIADSTQTGGLKWATVFPELISSGTIASGASVILQQVLSTFTQYTRFVVYFDDLVFSASPQAVGITFSIDGGATFLSTGYSYISQEFNGSGTVQGSNGSSLASIPMPNFTLGSGVGFTVELLNMNAAAKPLAKFDILQPTNIAAPIYYEGVGLNQTGGINAVKFTLSAGTISGTASKYRVYGYP